MLVLTFLASTVASGMTAPAGSVIVPVMEPVMVWAQPEETAENKRLKAIDLDIELTSGKLRAIKGFCVARRRTNSKPGLDA
jgi:hypothetical protein